MKVSNDALCEVATYWRRMDGLEMGVYRLLQRERPGLVEDLRRITDRYRKRSRNTLDFDEVNILHRRLETHQDAQEGEESKNGFVYLFLRSMAQKRRIKARDALYCEYLIRYSEFQRTVYKKYYAVLKKAVEETDPDGKPLAESKEYFGEVIPIYGTTPAEMMDANAAYYMRKLRDRAIADEQLPAREFESTVNSALNDMLGYSDRTENFFGYMDRMWLYEHGKRRVDELRRNDVEKVWFVAVLDHATTDQCRELNGSILRVADLEVGRNAPPIYPPPHPCRSRLVPIHT